MIMHYVDDDQAEGSTSQEGFESFERLTPRVQTNDYIIPQCSNERLYYPLVFKRTIILSPSVQTNDYIIPQCSNERLYYPPVFKRYDYFVWGQGIELGFELHNE